ncbi:MAG: hypothetical protein P4L51_13155 [Puia sp.]|nr:hypothetical protein [Puia sp.]
MLSDLDPSIEFLERSDCSNAYFSYTTDPTGEFGMISANEEGLRLYAAELLRIARTMGRMTKTEPLYFNCREWMVSETGYDLIAGVSPQFHTRAEILAERQGAPAPSSDEPKASPGKPGRVPVKGCFGTALLLAVISLILFASVKGFTNLRSWVNIH